MTGIRAAVTGHGETNLKVTGLGATNPGGKNPGKSARANLRAGGRPAAIAAKQPATAP